MTRPVREYLSLGQRVETPDGVHFVFVNHAAPVIIVFVLVMTMTFVFANRSAMPLFLLLAVPLCFLKTTWKFRYQGPSVECHVTLFGWSISQGKGFPLRQGDRAYVEETLSAGFGSHPPWRRVTLWSVAMNGSYTVVRAREDAELEQLDSTAEVFNDAIEKVLRGARE